MKYLPLPKEESGTATRIRFSNFAFEEKAKILSEYGDSLLEKTFEIWYRYYLLKNYRRRNDPRTDI